MSCPSLALQALTKRLAAKQLLPTSNLCFSKSTLPAHPNERYKDTFRHWLRIVVSRSNLAPREVGLFCGSVTLVDRPVLPSSFRPG
jgi:hypothetical protein